ncbi:MAG TPA: zf-TFIIB domain-containing protein [Myxococcaceae bacterium]|nr:zf-TFIIB domain-containing protein [Myxococcaceae bacterium]
MNDQTVDPEDQYFAAEDVEKLRRLAREQKQKLEQEERERLRALHHMKCPKCGLDLETLHMKDGNVDVDVCVGCHGVWLDAGELEQLQKQPRDPHRTFMGAVLNIFRGK